MVKKGAIRQLIRSGLDPQEARSGQGSPWGAGGHRRRGAEEYGGRPGRWEVQGPGGGAMT